MTKQIRLPSESRRQDIFNAIIRVAQEKDYRMMTREDIATAAGVSLPLVTTYFGSMPEIRRMAVAHGVRTGNLLIIGQAMAARDPLVRRVDYATKLRAAAKYLGITLPADK